MKSAASQIRLSPTQREVVDFGDGPLLVVAGPGTGKTRVLTERVRRLLSIRREHFRVLALTFTNKAAREMEERLDDLGELGTRTFIGTLHGFCLDMLSDRGKAVGVVSTPQIFEQFSDRRQVLAEAVEADPLLNHELLSAVDTKDRTRKLESWLRAISDVKNHPITRAIIDDAFEQRVIGFNSSGFDLPVLRYRAFVLAIPAQTLHGSNGKDYWYRYGRDHLDICDVISGYGASPRPSLAELAALAGTPAKIDEIDGSQVEAMATAGRLEELAAYCDADVFVTYLLFLRFSLITGEIDLDCYSRSLASLHAHIVNRISKRAHLQGHLRSLELMIAAAEQKKLTDSASSSTPTQASSAPR